MDKSTDLEICKRIAEIEGHTVLIELPVGISDSAIYVYLNNGITPRYRIVYNPLTDDGLCFQLMVKYKVLITWQDFNNNCTAVIDGTSDDLPFAFAIADINDKSPNRAICLAIIESFKNEIS